uniref:Uncharacterized protein n=1 Tax=Anguilla anguilla TaxID=7936 RepID=A0A0E9U8I9_ANGAN
MHTTDSNTIQWTLCKNSLEPDILCKFSANWILVQK